MVTNRPSGVTIFSISFAITAITDLILGILALQSDLFTSAYFIISGIIIFLIVYGLWELKSWGWISFIGLLAIGLVQLAVEVFVSKLGSLTDSGATQTEIDSYLISNTIGYGLFLFLMILLGYYFYSLRDHFKN